MNKPLFKKLLGNRVYLLLPKIPESRIQLSEEVKKSIISKEREKLMKLTVYAVGDSVSPDVLKEGDVVKVDDRMLSSAPMVDLGGDITVIQVAIFDIAHIW
jgi:hypothetical protein